VSACSGLLYGLLHKPCLAWSAGRGRSAAALLPSWCCAEIQFESQRWQRGGSFWGRKALGCRWRELSCTAASAVCVVKRCSLHRGFGCVFLGQSQCSHCPHVGCFGLEASIRLKAECWQFSPQ